MGVNTITIEQRYYLGHYREGTVFNSVEDYLVDGDKVSAHITKRYYCGRDERGRNKFGFAREMAEFELSESDCGELANILGRIKEDPDTKFSANHYQKGVFDRKRFDYLAAIINGSHYELNKSSAEMAGGLMRILRVDEMLAKCNTGYDEPKPEVATQEKKEPAKDWGKILSAHAEEKAPEEKDAILLEKPEVHEPEKILAKNEEGESEDKPLNEIVIEMKESEPKEEAKEEPKPARGGFHRELLTKPNHANWNQVAGKY